MYKYTAKNLKPTVITSEIILYNFVFLIHLKEKKNLPSFFETEKSAHAVFQHLNFPSLSPRRFSAAVLRP